MSVIDAWGFGFVVGFCAAVIICRIAAEVNYRKLCRFIDEMEVDQKES